MLWLVTFAAAWPVLYGRQGCRVSGLTPTSKPDEILGQLDTFSWLKE